MVIAIAHIRSIPASESTPPPFESKQESQCIPSGRGPSEDFFSKVGPQAY